MPTLHDISKRIDSVASTRKITSTMEMVARTKIHRAQERVHALRWALCTVHARNAQQHG